MTLPFTDILLYLLLAFAAPGAHIPRLGAASRALDAFSAPGAPDIGDFALSFTDILLDFLLAFAAPGARIPRLGRGSQRLGHVFRAWGARSLSFT